MNLPLSVLDLVPLAEGMTSPQALAHSLGLARHVERLGYARVWYAEHHNMPAIASTSPEIMVARAIAETSRIRLGAGGVMLPNHAPLRVVEAYRMLEAMAPGRIDLGLGRAPGTDPTTALALRRSRAAVYADDFPEQYAELTAFAKGATTRGHPFPTVTAQPEDVALPPVWLLGSSDYSAHFAARFGQGYAFAAHFSPTAPEGPMRAYREEFRAGARAEPHAILALSVFCADTAEEAERLARPALVAMARLRTGRPAKLLSTEAAMAYALSPVEMQAASAVSALQIIGTPSEVRAEIEARVKSTRADEVMVATFSADAPGRARSFELLAQAFALDAST